MKKMFTDAKLVVKTIRNHADPLAVFERYQTSRYGRQNSISLKTPNPTRFSGSHMILECLEKNKSALQDTVLTATLAIDPNVKLIVLSGRFWKDVKSAKNMLTPIAEAIEVIESDKARLSLVPREWT